MDKATRVISGTWGQKPQWGFWRRPWRSHDAGKGRGRTRQAFSAGRDAAALQ